MKKALLAIAMACIATASFGWVGVTWSAFRLYDYQYDGSENKNTVFQNTETTKILWELVYTTADSVATPTMDETTGDITYQTGDKTLATRIWDSTKPEQMSLSEYVADGVDPKESTLAIKLPSGAIKTSGGADYINDTLSLTGGQVYAAVFQYLDNGDVYWATTGLSDYGTDSMSPAPSVGDWPSKGVVINNPLGTVTQVPEPATMSLLGLGALAMVIRRKLRK